ncbi:uncharacterized protein [Vulpes vulpes]|uniref:Uncharacterized protein n=1 Tax=Vulpes vulpes TaxID=9627 RepID=A0ABM4Z243_VULVU
MTHLRAEPGDNLTTGPRTRLFGDMFRPPDAAGGPGAWVQPTQSPSGQEGHTWLCLDQPGSRAGAHCCTHSTAGKRPAAGSGPRPLRAEPPPEPAPLTGRTCTSLSFSLLRLDGQAPAGQALSEQDQQQQQQQPDPASHSRGSSAQAGRWQRDQGAQTDPVTLCRCRHARSGAWASAPRLCPWDPGGCGGRREPTPRPEEQQARDRCTAGESASPPGAEPCC